MKEDIFMYKNLDLCFISGMFPPGYEKEIISNSKISVEFAANAFQHKLVEGLINNEVARLKIINSIFINSFPRGYTKILIKSNKFTLRNNNTEHENVGFFNLYYVRHFSKLFSLRAPIRKWTNSKFTNKVLIGYTAINPTLELFKFAKIKNSDIHTCLIVPDLPDLCRGKNRLYNYFLNKVSNKMKKYEKYIDSYVLLTHSMKEKLQISKKFVVIEGLINVNSFNQPYNRVDDGIKRILYAGTLDEKYGIKNLIHAFKTIIDSNYQLWICGTGDEKDFVVKSAKEDERIVYYGVIEQDMVNELQRKATILVNPRQNTEEFTKYSFPSKTLDYLISGTPMIGYKLDGIPKEYDDYINYVLDNSIESLADKIKLMCNKPIEELNEMGLKAKKFVTEQKNVTIQTRKILEMITNER